MKYFVGPHWWAVLMSLVFSLRSVGSVPGDEHWDNEFGPTGTSDQVLAITFSGNNMLVGGWFTAAGNNNAYYVAAFDGSNWSDLNGGVTNDVAFNPTFVTCLATDGANVYAGGYFTKAGGVPAQNVARWDGKGWSSLGGGVSGPVESLKLVGTNLYVGGYFTSAGGVPANSIACWNGSGWSALGGGISGGFIPTVNAMEWDGTNLFVGGSFTTAGVAAAANIARWDGSTWSSLASGMSGQVSCMLLRSNALYVGGGFTNSGGINVTNTAEWDGNSWSAWAMADRPVQDLVAHGPYIYMAGNFSTVNGKPAAGIALWDSANWSGLGAGIQSYGSASRTGSRIAFDPSGRLYVAGYFNTAGSAGASHIAGWDGTNWFALGAQTCKGLTHTIGLVRSTLAVGTNVFIGGNFTEAGTAVVNCIAQWNGANWLALGSGFSGYSQATTVRAIASDGLNVYAGGYFTTAGGVPATNIARWDGNNWTSLGPGFNAWVSALATNGSDLYAGGLFTATADGVPLRGIARWDGSSWNDVLGGVFGGGSNIGALASDGVNIYAAGNFTGTVSGASMNIARWDGVQWNALGSGLNATVHALAIGSDGTVYAGGGFTTAGGVSANHVAKWDGTSWSALGNGVNGNSSSIFVNGIAVSGQTIYVVGNFTNAGTVYASGIAKWDGNSWSALGSSVVQLPGMSGVQAVALMGNDLLVGGGFEVAGSKPSFFIGRWNEQMNFNPAPQLQLVNQSWSVDNHFHFGVLDAGGATYWIQASTDLISWATLQTNSTSVSDLVDTNSITMSGRFYRAVLAH